MLPSLCLLPKIVCPHCRPLGTILFNTLIEGSHRIFTGADLNLPEIIINQEVAVIERCANVLALLFINGGQVSSELCTVISTSHISPSGKSRVECTYTLPFHFLVLLSSHLPMSPSFFLRTKPHRVALSVYFLTHLLHLRLLRICCCVLICRNLPSFLHLLFMAPLTEFDVLNFRI